MEQVQAELLSCQCIVSVIGLVFIYQQYQLFRLLLVKFEIFSPVALPNYQWFINKLESIQLRIQIYRRTKR